MSYKQPRSIQVIIFCEGQGGHQYLLLRRIAEHGGFWQSVTGSLEGDETHREAAVREVLEETGLSCSADDLIDLNLVNVFEIAPLWRQKFAPGVTHNEEVCFALKAEKFRARLDPLEHEDQAWVGYDEAFEMLYWASSRRALAALDQIRKRGERS